MSDDRKVATRGQFGITFVFAVLEFILRINLFEVLVSLVVIAPKS